MDCNFIVDNIRKIVASHKLAPGKYRRWNFQNEDGTHDMEPSPYGCADAANLLYTIGDFPSDESERRAFVESICSFQNEESGLFEESTHRALHTTAHCTAALELFEAKPKHPMKALFKYADPDILRDFLENLEWEQNPWESSHDGAGLYAAYVLAGHADREWEQVYFDWFYDQADPETGLWRNGYVTQNTAPVPHYMAGSFHYLFNHEYAKMPLRYPDKMIDTCLEILKNVNGREIIHPFSFFYVDVTYCLTRALRQCGHRFDEVKEELSRFAQKYVARLSKVSWSSDREADDIHGLFGMACCLAELQSALPGKIRTDVPLKLVLDRRPFI